MTTTHFQKVDWIVVWDAALGGQEDRGALDPGGSNSPQQLESRCVGEKHVQEQQVIGPARREVEASLGVRHVVH